MLRLSCLSRVFAPAPLRLGRKKHGAFGHKLHKFSTTSKGCGGGGDDDDDDDEHGYHEADFDDMEFSDDDDDFDDFDDFDDVTWMEQGNAQLLGAADRKIEEHVKQKVRVQRAKHSKRRFVDRIRIKATGGHGGNGCSSFFSESAMRKRPNGGHGGAGGNVIIEADDRIQNLANATHHFKGGAGLNGMPNDAAGRRGKHCFVKVPCGTLVKRVKRFERELENGEFEIVDKMETVCDLDKPGATFLAAIGGKPGLGNRILAGKTTNFGRLRKHMPDTKGIGSPGTSQYYELELKTIADVGLVGYPNAGKSTLLSTLSRATPEIAPYPFTTLHPYVGIVEFPDTYRLSVADIPGLIEGAHRNVGLGHDFLRHIERTKILMYVLDTAGTEGRDPTSDFTHLQRELELYAPDITTRPSLIIANKMDEQGKAPRLVACLPNTYAQVRMHRYETMELLGNGSFGEVVKARSLKTNEIVAIKKIKALFPTWEECLQLRELKSLRVLRHENIVQLKEVIRDKEELYFVFEYMQSSLCKVMQLARHQQRGESDIAGATSSSNGTGSSPSLPASPPSWLSEAQIRSVMYQLFCGLAHMHKHGFFHRDIKPENLLCHEDTLKLADLGQAREIRSRPPYTDYVSTRWYRAPELLLRFHSYNSPIDLWACGCIMAELFLQAPLFPGSSEVDQLCRICKVLGTPTKDTWADGVTMVAHMQFKFPKCASVPWTHILPPNTSKPALQLIQEPLQYDPSRRITAAQALQHRYFDQHPVTRPMLTPPAQLQTSMVQQQLSLKAEYKSSSMACGGASKKGGDDDGPVHSGWTRSSTENLGLSRKHGYNAASSSSYLQARHNSVLLSPREQQLPIATAESKSSLSSSAWRDAEKKSAKGGNDTCHSAQKCSVASPEDFDDSGKHKDDKRHHHPQLQQSIRTQSEDHLLQDLLDEFIA